MVKGIGKKTIDAAPTSRVNQVPRPAVTSAEYRAIVTEGLSSEQLADIRQQLEGRARLA